MTEQPLVAECAATAPARCAAAAQFDGRVLFAIATGGFLQSGEAKWPAALDAARKNR